MLNVIAVSSKAVPKSGCFTVNTNGTKNKIPGKINCPMPNPLRVSRWENILAITITKISFMVSEG